MKPKKKTIKAKKKKTIKPKKNTAGFVFVFLKTLSFFQPCQK